MLRCWVSFGWRRPGRCGARQSQCAKVSPAPGSAGVGCQGLVEGQLTEPETFPTCEIQTKEGTLYADVHVHSSHHIY